MTEQADGVEWHGWMHEERALYITPTPDGEHVGLYLQQGRSTELCAVFVDPAVAQMVMQWQDEALAVTAAANAELLRRLENEQPLLFQVPVDQEVPDLPSYDGEVTPLEDEGD